MVERIDVEDLGAYVRSLAPLRVYLASSLTSDDRAGFRDELLREVGAAFAGEGFEVYSPGQHTNPGSPHREIEVTAIDHLEVMRSDFVFFIRLQPSLGLGIEAQIAADMLIPWADVRIAGPSLKPCPLVAGLANGPGCFRFSLHAENRKDFVGNLTKWLQDASTRESLERARHDRGSVSQIVRRIGIGRAIRQQRLLLNMRVAELADLVDLEPWWISSVETDPDVASCLSLMQIMRLVDTARLKFVLDRSAPELSFPRLVPADRFNAQLVAAAVEFTDYSLRPRMPAEPVPDTDEAMLDHWVTWLRKDRGLEVPVQPRSSSEPVSKLTAFVAMPMSDVEPNDQKKRQSVVGGVEEGLRAIRAVTVEARTPELRSNGRDDFGYEIYLATISRLHQCDFGIAYVTPPATGVGLMSRLFANLTMPCLSLAEIGSRVSRMFRGMYGRQLGPILEFGATDVVAGCIESTVTGHLVELCESAARRRAVRARVNQASVTRAVDRFRIPRSLSFDRAVEQLKRVDFLRDDWLEKLMRDPSVLPTVSLLQFVHIANKLRWKIGVSASGVPCYVPPCATGVSDTASPPEVVESSLDGLLAAREVASADDETVFRVWEDYSQQLLAGAAIPVRSIQDWLAVLSPTGVEPPLVSAAATQKLLFGTEECESSEPMRLGDQQPTASAAALFLLSRARGGLPPHLLAHAVGEAEEAVEAALVPEFKSGVLVAENGLWKAGKLGEAAAPDGHEKLVHRALDALFDCVQFDPGTAYSRKLYENTLPLIREADPLPAVLDAQMRLLDGRGAEACEIARPLIGAVRVNDSIEHVVLLILLGCAATSLPSATGLLDEAIGICERVLARTDERDPEWRRLLTRAVLARGIVSQKWSNPDARHYLSRATGLCSDAGNRFGTSIAEWQLISKQSIPRRQYDRLNRESPQVRVEAVQVFTALDKSTAAAVGRRVEPTDSQSDAQWQRCVEVARSRCSRQPKEGT